MAISSNNIQVYTTLSKELVTEIDKDAKANYRTRSQQINMILTEYYKTCLLYTSISHTSEFMTGFWRDVFPSVSITGISVRTMQQPVSYTHLHEHSVYQ